VLHRIALSVVSEWYQFTEDSRALIPVSHCRNTDPSKIGYLHDKKWRPLGLAPLKFIADSSPPAIRVEICEMYDAKEKGWVVRFLQRIRRGRSVNAQSIRRELEKDTSDTYYLYGAEVLGKLDLRHRVIKRPIEIHGCEFRGEIDLRYCEFKQVDLTRLGGHPRVWRQSLREGSPSAGQSKSSLHRGVQGRGRSAGPFLIREVHAPARLRDRSGRPDAA
jgi:hypothetical protein